MNVRVGKHIALGLILVLLDAVLNFAQSQVKVDPNPSPDPYKYDPVEICMSSGCVLFKISNSGMSESIITITAITLVDTDISQFKIDTGGGTGLMIQLKSGDSPYEVTVSFHPTSPGVKNATLRISSQDDKGDSLTDVDIKLTGTGESKPVLMIKPEVLVFDYADTVDSVTITNIGCDTLALTATSSKPWIKVTLPNANLPHGNNNQLKAKITVDRTKVCTARPYHETVTIDAGAFGDTTISVQVFVYNPPPRLVRNSDSVAITLTQRDQEFYQFLPPLFHDSSDADLSFEVRVDSDTAIAIMPSPPDNFFAVKPKLLKGGAVITVTASDGCPEIAAFRLLINVAVNQPPEFKRQLLSTPIANSGFPVQVIIVNDQVGTSVKTHYREGGGSNFKSLDMTPLGSGIYRADIPGKEVTSRGLEYFFTGRNDYGESALPKTGFFVIPVSVGNLPNPLPQPSGADANDYRLFSMPLQLNERFAKAVLEDDLGRYNNTQWRVLGLRADQTYAGLKDAEVDTLQIHAGRAYWLIVKEKGRTIDTGLGISIPTDTLFQIPLHPRWNFIGNPFSFAIPFDKLALKSTGTAPTDVRIYDGNEFVQAPKDSLRPFEGYALPNDSFSNDTLLVNPVLFPRSSSAPKANGIAVEPQKVSSLRIKARCRQAENSDNVASFISDALSVWDWHDRPEPPVIGDWVSVYFPHPEWQRVFHNYTTDARPVPLEGEIWEFEVLTNMTDKVELTFEGIESVPPQFEVRLWDEALQLSRDLRKTPTYTVAGRGPEHPKRLKLVVGKSSYVDPLLAETQKVPATYELSQNFPNPFNPSTTIRYGLPEAGAVTLKVYSLKGEEVAVLVRDEQQAPGYHAAVWNGRNTKGEIVGSGIYWYQLRAGSFSQTLKMALLK